MIAMIHRLQPTCVVNNRADSAASGGGADAAANRGCLGDYATPERNIPAAMNEPHAFMECCDAIGQTQWRYDADQGYWSVPELIRRLSRVASLGGNYLLNMAPMGDGALNPQDTQRLAAIGEWMKVHRAAVFGTQASPIIPRDAWFPSPVIGCATQADKSLFLHLHQWPVGDAVVLRHVAAAPLRAALMGSKAALVVESAGDRLVIRRLPPRPPVDSVNVIRLEFRKPARVRRNAFRAESAAPVLAPAGETVYLRPATAQKVAQDGVPVHSTNRFANGNVSIGPIYRQSEQIVWRVRGERAGWFQVSAGVASAPYQKGGVFGIEIGRCMLTGCMRVTKGEHTWNDTPARAPAGRVRVTRGTHTVRFGIARKANYHIGHLHYIVLQPERGSR